MNRQDRKVVRKGIMKQYFPNQQGNFNMKEMKSRKTGIQSIEKQYIDRMKFAAETDGFKHRRSISITNEKVLSNRTPGKAGLTGMKFHTLNQDGDTNRSEMKRQSMPNPDDMSVFTSAKIKGGMNRRRQRPLDNLLDDKTKRENIEAEVKQAKLKFPLLKGSDDLDDLLKSMIKPEDLKKIRAKAARDKSVGLKDGGNVPGLEYDNDYRTINVRSTLGGTAVQTANNKSKIRVKGYGSESGKNAQNQRKL